MTLLRIVILLLLLLGSVPFMQTLYFIDADDQCQLAWLKNQKSTTLSVKVILVSHDIAQATKALGAPVNNRATSSMRQQVKDLCRTLSVHDSVQEVAP